jgi:hypothetical protein
MPSEGGADLDVIFPQPEGYIPICEQKVLALRKVRIESRIIKTLRSTLPAGCSNAQSRLWRGPPPLFRNIPFFVYLRN